MTNLTLVIVCIALSFVISALVSFLIVNSAITQIFKFVDEQIDLWTKRYEQTTTEILKKAGLLK